MSKNIKTYIDELDKQRDLLARLLVQKGVTASEEETLNALVPKVLDIKQGGGSIRHTKHITIIMSEQESTFFDLRLISGEIINASGV